MVVQLGLVPEGLKAHSAGQAVVLLFQKLESGIKPAKNIF
jgi:hypothetical protein